MSGSIDEPADCNRHGFMFNESITVAPSQGTDSVSDEGDEVQAVRNAARKDTLNIRLWRLMVTGALLATAVTVTWTTYRFLQDEQDENFDAAFKQFSKTVGDAAVDQQQALRMGYRGLANSITAAAQVTNQTWPFVSIEYYVTFAQTFLEQTPMEVVACLHRVEHDQLEEWVSYTTETHEKMIQGDHIEQNGNLDKLKPVGFHSYVTRPSPAGFVEDIKRDYYFPLWENAPATFTYGFVNWNAFSIPDYDLVSKAIFALKNQTIISNVRKYIGAGIGFTQEEHEVMHAKLKDSSTEHPHSFAFHPVHEKVGDYNSKIVAVLGGGAAWDAALKDLLPSNVKGFYAVIKNDCNQSYTYVINGGDAIFEGNGDLHDTKYDSYERKVDLALNDHADFATTPGHCQYSMFLYPSRDFQQPYDKFTPEIFAIIVCCTFVFVAVVFFIYDLFVYRRNERLVENAAKSNAIVSSLFPRNIRDRLITNSQTGKNKGVASQISGLKSFLAGDIEGSGMDSRPMADLFLDTTILFADIAGFTAWSSVREPSQVFTFLEKIFSSFDQIAKARRVFKVETVGDCYVAATGIPDPRKDHAVVMVQFACDILTRVNVMTKELEITHGPDTGDLSLRIGIHSGPVTAGVLRGERARFQLFGDTMNTASRIEHTGQVGRIQVSTETAEYLKFCGKGHWLIKREHMVKAKGKGDMQTYWIGSGYDQKDRGSCTSNSDAGCLQSLMPAASRPVDQSGRVAESGLDERSLRLVDWNVEMLLNLIKQIVARKHAINENSKTVKPRRSQVYASSANWDQPSAHPSDIDIDIDIGATFNPLDEVREIISLPEFDSKIARQYADPDQIHLDPVIVQQLRELIASIASMYRANSFHNFEHASHVTMSVIKLLARIVAPTDLMLEKSIDGISVTEATDQVAASLHDHTYGITSDPLTQFACAFSALIHDVDHLGVTNAQLVKEKTRIAALYNNRSVAEQNSVVLAWDLFMAEDFLELRECICSTTSELRRLRQLVVNGVMATDIVDADLKKLRNDRWDKAFNQQPAGESVSSPDDPSTQLDDPRDAINRKATIVIEHLIQASDVAHTMQHWHVYRKWNERLFKEFYTAYQAGRSGTNPMENWYEGEIGFFDFYIIPLAKKLKECGVFGKSSDEYLNYAMANRKEWEARGREVLADMVDALDLENSSISSESAKPDPLALSASTSVSMASS